jgi:hypothetical protein
MTPSMTSYVLLKSKSSIALQLTPAELVEVHYYNPLPMSRFAFGVAAAITGLMAVGGAVAWAGGDTRAGKPMTLVAGPLFAIFQL